jgi:hypothetical protein
VALLRALAALLAVACALAPSGVGAQVLTQDEALALAFPGATLLRQTAYLSEEDIARVRQLAGGDVAVESSVVSYYVARSGSETLGVAYFDAHRVRTLPEVLMIVVGTDSRIRRVETVSFREPPEYRAPDGWLRLFGSRALDERLSLKGEIPTMTGATLTSGAVTQAARRVLALHSVIAPLGRAGP